MSEYVIDSNSKLKEVLTKNEDLTFLIGAGCSIDQPSRLAAGGQMMKAIIEYVCAESEIKNIFNLMKHLRFEELVEIVRNHADPDLNLIDYYGACDKPNLQHFYLAEMISKGRYVITTNFDFLIEYALLQSQIPKQEIILLSQKKIMISAKIRKL